MLTLQAIGWDCSSGSAIVVVILPHLSVSVSFDVILTLMIITRLVLHTRNTRTAMGAAGLSGSCKTITTMLIESPVFYALNSLLVVGQLTSGMS